MGRLHWSRVALNSVHPRHPTRHPMPTDDPTPAGPVPARPRQRPTAGPAGLNDAQRAALTEAVALFNAGRYFECHEVLEDAWRAAAEPDRTILKGLIHAAVALYQYQRGNSHGARVKTASAYRYLAPALPEYE